MNPQLRKIFYWSARMLGIFLVTAVVRQQMHGIDLNLPLAQALLELLSHLWMTLLLAAALLIAWRWEIVGAIIYVLIAGFIVLDMKGATDPVYYLFFVVPYAIVALLFLISGLMKTPTPKGEKDGVP